MGFHDERCLGGFRGRKCLFFRLWDLESVLDHLNADTFRKILGDGSEKLPTPAFIRSVSSLGGSRIITDFLM